MPSVSRSKIFLNFVILVVVLISNKQPYIPRVHLPTEDANYAPNSIFKISDLPDDYGPITLITKISSFILESKSIFS